MANRSQLHALIGVAALGLLSLGSSAETPARTPVHTASLYLANGTLEAVELNREQPRFQLDQHPSLVRGILFGVDRTDALQGDQISIHQGKTVLANAAIKSNYDEHTTGSYRPFLVHTQNLCEDITVTVTRNETVLSQATLRLMCGE